MNRTPTIKYPCTSDDCNFAVILPADHSWTELANIWQVHYDERHPEVDEYDEARRPRY